MMYAQYQSNLRTIIYKPFNINHIKPIKHNINRKQQSTHPAMGVKIHNYI